MNPYEVSQTSSDTIQSLLATAQKLCDGGGGGGEVAAAERLHQRLAQLHHLHSRSWHILRHNNEHAAFVMARLESMDVLCARLVPAMDAARTILSRGKIAAADATAAAGSSGRSAFSLWRILRRNRAAVCCWRPAGGGTAAPLEAMTEELGNWLDYQEDVVEILSCQAFGLAPPLLASALEGYQSLGKLTRTIREELTSSQRRVVIVHGPSGVGKSSLAAYIAANPPESFADSVVELRVGKTDEIQLKDKLRLLLQELNCQREVVQRSRDLWSLLEAVAAESAHLIVLDDVCDKEIVDRVIQLKPHSSKFLITCRESPVPYVEPSSSVATIELGFRDTASVSRDVLRFHTGMPDRKIPAVVSKLLRHCSHHPLAVSILGEALRGSWRREEWNAVVEKLEVCSKNHLNWLAGVMSTIELSSLGLAHDTKELFFSLSALSWNEPVPVECLQALWSASGKKSPFLLHARELVRRCLLIRTPDFLLYELHDLVAMFLNRKSSGAVNSLLNLSPPRTRAVAAPWLLRFGNKESKQAAAEVVRGILLLDNDELHASLLSSIVDVLKSSSGDEEIRKEVNAIVGAEIVNLLFRASSPPAYAAIAKYIAACFRDRDYEEFGRGLVASELVEKFRTLLSSSGAPGINILIKKDVVEVIAKLASAGSSSKDRYVAESLIRASVIDDLVLLLDARSGWILEGVLAAVVKVAGIGEAAVKQLLDTDMLDVKLLLLLRNRKGTIKARALAALESLMKVGGAKVVARVVSAGVLEELETLLNSPCEEIQMSACVVCREMFARGSSPGSSPAIMEQVLRSRVVEVLTGLLGDEMEVLRSRAVGVLQVLVQARGEVVADRIVRAAGVDSMQRGLEVMPNEVAFTAAYKRLLKSIMESRKSCREV